MADEIIQMKGASMNIHNRELIDFFFQYINRMQILLYMFNVNIFSSIVSAIFKHIFLLFTVWIINLVIL